VQVRGEVHLELSKREGAGKKVGDKLNSVRGHSWCRIRRGSVKSMGAIDLPMKI